MKLKYIITLFIAIFIAFSGNAQNAAHKRAHQNAAAQSGKSELISKNTISIDKSSLVNDFKNDVSAKSETLEMLDDVIKEANKHKGKRYVWGSKGPNTFDCSGFTSYVYKQFGYNIGSDSRIQYSSNKTSVSRTELRKGDLVFFSKGGPNGRISHVGMVVSADGNGNFQFIHASCSRGVTISSINEKYYSSKYVGARRIIND